jgi:hypothetical protein
MAILNTIDVVQTALWPQHDIRDPLGVWGGRNIFGGDATGGSYKIQIQVPADQRRAYVYTCYSVNSVQTGGADNVATLVKCRLLTNWPDVDPVTIGVQGYSTWSTATIPALTGFTVPHSGPSTPLVAPQDRFLLLFDPSITGAGLPLVLVEVERNANTDSSQYSTEAWGYFWDRSVLDAPGGPRHPGSS